MCGIYGYWDGDRRPMPAQALAAMDVSLLHRGPDDNGVHHVAGRGVAIGNRRLSIIDLAGGHQPMLSDDGQVAVVQNGEIFNYVELAAELRAAGVALKTHSDTEVILRLYEREGIACLRRLNGMFAIAIDDAREDALYLARDRIGVKPLFVGRHGGRVLFGSEVKALVAAAPGLAGADQLDLEALHHYLSFNYIPAPWTAWKGVRHVMPGTWMRFGRGTERSERWWNLAGQNESPVGFQAWSEEFLALMDDATRIRLRSDVPWGAFLSGGVDSSTIVALMARHVDAPVKTFCIGFDDPRFDESAFAVTAALRFGCDHTSEQAELNMLDRWPEVLRYLDQPHGDASFMPTLRVSELAARHVKVVLTGDGGDELFAGYDKYADFFASAAAHAPQARFEREYFDAISLFSQAEKAALYTPSMAATVRGSDSFDAVARPWLKQGAHFGRINQALFLDMQLLLCGNNLVKPDRMGMVVSIEARTPFLDWRVMEFAFRTPGHAKLSVDGEKKHWYKKAVAPLIGEDLAYRRKQMFTVPIGEWFRAERHAWLGELLLGSDFVLDVARREVIVRMLDEHRAGTVNHTRGLRALAAVALWAQQAGLAGTQVSIRAS